MMSKPDAGLMLEAEHPHREPSYRACHAVTIEVERGKAGRANVLDRVHLHAVDDSQEILLREIEVTNRACEAGDQRALLALVKRPHLRAPLVKLLQPLRARAARIGDIVDTAAEIVDLVHGVALRLRQDAH